MQSDRKRWLGPKKLAELGEKLENAQVLCAAPASGQFCFQTAQVTQGGVTLSASDPP